MRNALVQIVTAGDMSADITSSVVQLDQDFGYSVQANYSTNGTLGGTFKIQCSNDYAPSGPAFGPAVTGNWIDVTGTSVTISGASSSMWNVIQPNYRWARLVYTHLGGDSGTLNAYVFERSF